MHKRKITGGLYLVVDPSMELPVLLFKIKSAIAGGVKVLQIWNHWAEGSNKETIANAICAAAHAHNVPVLINEEWSLLQTTALDGVHFDVLPTDMEQIRKNVQRPFLCGITCGNDLAHIAWANSNGCDYISFCSMFPSASAGVCEIVQKETVLQARAATLLPIFLAGGISTNNIQELAGTGLNGVAIISAIMSATDPQQAAAAFVAHLKTIDKI